MNSLFGQEEALMIAGPTLRFKTNFTNCVLKALRAKGWTQTDYEDWDLFWAEKQDIPRLFEGYRMQQSQKVNHHRNYFQICRKDNLYRNFKKYRKGLEKGGERQQAQKLNFCPLSFLLPSQYPIFADQFRRTSQGEGKAIWIMKPACRSQGKGIFLFKNLAQVSGWAEGGSQVQAYVVQRYIHDPLLFGGKKFDLRLYVLCTSYSPLTVYLYRSGFARFTHERYDISKIEDASIHLTNVNVQKHCSNYDPGRGGKWSIEKMRSFLLSKLGLSQTQSVFAKIQDMIVRTMQAAAKVLWPDKRCFQLYGFDVMLDKNYKPWLIQVNGSPSMTANTPQDCELKCGLIDDVLTILNFDGFLQGEQKQIGGFDLIIKEKPINQYSMLGCFNNRVRQKRAMLKELIARKKKESTKELPPKKLAVKPYTSGSRNKASLNTETSTRLRDTAKSNFLIRRGKGLSTHQRKARDSKQSQIADTYR